MNQDHGDEHRRDDEGDRDDKEHRGHKEHGDEQRHHGRDDDFEPVQPSRSHGGGANSSPAPSRILTLATPPLPLDIDGEALSMRERFPHFEMVKAADEWCWVGDITPFRRLSEAARIIADLEANRPVGVASSTALRHLPGCDGEHFVPALVESLGQSPSLQTSDKLVVFAPRRSGQPTVFSLDHNYDPRHQPHVYANPRGGLCTRFAPDQDLNPKRSIIVQEVEQAIIYVAKQIVWRLTALVGERGHWLGADVGHLPIDYLKNTPESACCPACNSGKPYKDCCYHQHLRAIFHLDDARDFSVRDALRRLQDLTRR